MVSHFHATQKTTFLQQTNTHQQPKTTKHPHHHPHSHPMAITTTGPWHTNPPRCTAVNGEQNATKRPTLKRKAETDDNKAETLNPKSATSKDGDDKISKSHSCTRANKSKKMILKTLNQQSMRTNKLTITKMPTNHLQHTEKKNKQEMTATKMKCHPLLMTKPKRHTKPKRYTFLAKTMVGIHSPTMVKGKMTLNRHQKVTMTALWNHLQIVIIRARKV